MSPTRIAIVLAVLLAALVAPDATAAPIFASPPHVVSDGDGQRIVLFLNEPVSGALASRAGDGFVVRVPRSEVASTIQGQDFGADGWGNGGDAVKHLVVAAGEQGDTTIRIQPTGPVRGVDARSVDDPPRLVIDLLATAPTATPRPTRTPVPTRTAVRSPARSVAPTAVPKAKATEPVRTNDATAAATKSTARAAATPRPTSTATPRPTATATPGRPRKPAPTATAVVEPIAIADAGADLTNATDVPDTLAHATVMTALAAAPPSEPGAHAVADGPASAPSVPAPRIVAAQTFGLGCLWRRFGGVAMCVADPKAAPYVGDHTITALVGALARGKLPEPEDTPAVVTPALLYLEADVLFATRAPDGKLLPVVDAYRRALRLHPEFPEAWRARLNIALAYRAMEFATELKTAARASMYDPVAGLVRGLAGDLAFVTGKNDVAAEEYRDAGELGGLGACLAGRGRARLALVDGNATAAAAELAALGSLCPAELATDSETVWVRGRLALAQQDYAGARTLLGEAVKDLDKSDRGAVLADLAAVAEAAGDAKTARRTYEQLLGGAFGARVARQATVRLAVLDGVSGDVGGGLKRLERLTPEASDPARRVLVMQSVRSALARGAAGEALAALHDAHVDPTQLALEDQLVIADAYRGLGLASEAERLLAAAQSSAGPTPPENLFAARGALAIDRRDGTAASAVADDWIRIHGRNAGALALRARAAALRGDVSGAHAAVAAAIMEDPKLTRTLGLDVAEALRSSSPAAALVLAREAMDPGPAPELPPARAAAGLALVGALAETAGDDDTALAAFTTLAARYAKEPVAADAAYRAARIAARRVPGGDAAAFDEAARSKDALARRVAGAARDYESIVKPLGGTRGVP